MASLIESDIFLTYSWKKKPPIKISPIDHREQKKNKILVVSQSIM